MFKWVANNTTQNAVTDAFNTRLLALASTRFAR